MIKSLVAVSTGAALLAMTSGAMAHGLIENPPARNGFCGLITKPDEVLNNVAEFPVCGDAFDINFTQGYSFMSVLTHTEGRSVVGPREHVCSFNSESFGGVATVWDQPIDWPTSPMSAGEQTFTWNISWGPHYSDTQEFRFWITRPDFQFQVGQPLSFDDFEDEPFCVLGYDDTNPNGNPDVIPDQAGALFHTTCTVPQRSGRHVIYAEWGRNMWTFERFHGCVDVVFGGGAAPASVPLERDALDDEESADGDGLAMGCSAAGSGGAGSAALALLFALFVTPAARRLGARRRR
jgi:chitin-binding protein